jgi:hypothetical protein
VLGALGRGVHPVLAARAAVAAASREVTGIGPQRLLDDPDHPGHADVPQEGERVVVDEARLESVAALVHGLEDVQPFAFVAAGLPPVGHEFGLDWFFSATLQQFGFWFDDGRQYVGPVIAPLGGVRRKGSDHLWAIYDRWLHDDPHGLTPAGQAAVTLDEVTSRCTDDDGQVMPSVTLRWELARAYGRSMTQLGWTPASMVAAANATDQPTAAFVRLLDHVGGYREDPYRKKSALLAAILRQRPEAWLRAVDGDDVPAIVDYHVQRSCLRTGLVQVRDEDLAARLRDRVLVRAEDEDAIRSVCFDAVTRLAARSGRSMGAVDWFLFQMRHRCPEMTVPDCTACPADPVCAHHTELFQPVLRTSAY